MKLLKVTYEHRAYTEDEAKDAILKFRNEAKDNVQNYDFRRSNRYYTGWRCYMS